MRAQTGPQPSGAAVQASSVPGRGITEHSSAAAAEATQQMTGVTNGRVLNLLSLDQTIKPSVARRAVRDVKTQPADTGAVDLPSAQAARATLIHRQMLDTLASTRAGSRGMAGATKPLALQKMESLD